MNYSQTSSFSASNLGKEVLEHESKPYPRVAIIILNWNDYQTTMECLESLKKLTYSNFEVVIVDNASSDGSGKILQKNFPQHHLISNAENLGFTEGNNVAIRWALDGDFKYVLLLNHDTVVEPNFLNTLIRIGESDPSIAILGPRIVYHSKPQMSWSIGGFIHARTGRPFHYKFLESVSPKMNNVIEEVEWVSGCALLIKTEIIHKIGLLDPDFFFGTEDVDWCLRARKVGKKIAYVHGSVVRHKKRSKVFIEKYSHLQHYYSLRNLLIFIEKHGSFNIPFLLSFSHTFLKRFGWCLIKLDFKSVKAMYLAIMDFRRKRYGKARITF